MADLWEEAFGHLCLYVEREGHTRIAANHFEDGYRLGQWVGVQRTAYAKGRLATDRVARLEALPGWSWNRIADLWEDGFRHLCRFVESEGHARVPVAHVDDGYRLGSWVNKQRTEYRNGKLADDRIARLESVPGWTWSARGGVKITRDD